MFSKINVRVRYSYGHCNEAFVMSLRLRQQATRLPSFR